MIIYLNLYSEFKLKEANSNEQIIEIISEMVIAAIFAIYIG